MPKEKLFDGSDNEEEVSFKTENEYAKRYDNWREKEELHKLEQKYGDKAMDSDGFSSDSEDESDEEPEIPEEVEEQFLKTLSLLKTRDPRIYDPNYKFFDEIEEKKKKGEEKKEENPKKKKELKSLADAFADSDDEEGNGQIFKIEKKALVPEKKEEKLKQYLSGATEHVDPDAERDLAPLRALWSKPDLDEGEAFLRDYILNKRYLDPDAGTFITQLRDDEALEADEKTVEEQGQFERAYNFRFEEPDQEFLKRYPRTMNSIRPKDDRRARKRAEIRERKEEEKRKKMEEIGRMKALKLKEIQQKLAKIKEVTGNEELAFKDSDLEGDFDPDEHDRRMRAIFDEQYYQEADDEKPQFPDLDEELEIENWENFDEGTEAVQQLGEDGPHCEDEEFNMDAEYDPKKARTTLLEEIQETLGKKRRNRKRKSKLAKVLATEKPKFIPEVTDKTYEQYMEEYYKMDCEDVIAGDLPTRFKYRETVPNSFGLTVEEILLADDKELNRWASLKKTVKYRPENVEKSEVKTYEQKAADLQLKKKMLPSLFKDIPEEPEVVVPIEEATKKRKKKKNKSKPNKNNVHEEHSLNVADNNDVNTSLLEKNSTEGKENKKGNNKEESMESNVDAINNTEENSSAKKKKKRKHKDNSDVPQETVELDFQSENDKENKHKHTESFVTNEADTVTNDLKNKHDESLSNKRNKKSKHKNSQYTGAVSNEVKKSEKTKHKEINNQENPNQPSQEGSTVGDKQSKKRKNKKHKGNPMKRKIEDASEGPVSKKKKLKNKNFKIQKNKENSSSDPLGKLSDERLKAYGLNPKKYRSFLKYKKF